MNLLTAINSVISYVLVWVSYVSCLAYYLAAGIRHNSFCHFHTRSGLFIIISFGANKVSNEKFVDVHFPLLNAWYFDDRFWFASFRFHIDFLDENVCIYQ